MSCNLKLIMLSSSGMEGFVSLIVVTLNYLQFGKCNTDKMIEIERKSAAS